MAAGRDGIDVELLPVDGGAPQPLAVGRVVNCSGPLSDIAAVRAPLVRALLDSGHAGPDPLGLGLDVTSDGAVIDRAGRPSDTLFAVGPITRGVFWETTAVPDIRLQCERLAAYMLGQLRPPALIPSMPVAGYASSTCCPCIERRTLSKRELAKCGGSFSGWTENRGIRHIDKAFATGHEPEGAGQDEGGHGCDGQRPLAERKSAQEMTASESLRLK